MSILVYHNGVLAADTQFLDLRAVGGTYNMSYGTKLFMSKDKKFYYGVLGAKLNKEQKMMLEKVLNILEGYKRTGVITDKITKHLTNRIRGLNCEVIAISTRYVYEITQVPNEAVPWAIRDLTETTVIGSASMFAWAAIDVLDSASAAVKHCVTYDSTCGGKMEYRTLKKLKEINNVAVL